MSGSQRLVGDGRDVGAHAGDEILATAILGRLLHRCHVLDAKDHSYMLRDLEHAINPPRRSLTEPDSTPGQAPAARAAGACLVPGKVMKSRASST